MGCDTRTLRCRRTHVVKSDGGTGTLDDIKPRSKLMLAGHLSLWHMGMVNNKPKWGLQIDADHIEVTQSENETGPSGGGTATSASPDPAFIAISPPST